MAKPKKQLGKKKRARRSRGPARDLPELQEARALWIRNRFAESLQLFDKAVRKEPSNPLALADAARAFGARFEIGRAERLLDRLLDIVGKRADLWQMAGQSYRMIQRPDRAIECLENALIQSGELFEARLELAMIYERRHQLDAALGHISTCLETHASSLEAKFLEGRILRRLGRVSAAETILRQVSGTASGHWSVRAQAWSELGQLLDDAGQFAGAMEAVHQSKEILRGQAGDELRRSAEEAQHVENVLAELTGQHFQRWREEVHALPPERVALLTGPPRSGTTLLEKVLDSHPHVVSSDEQVAFPKFIYPVLLGKKDKGLLSAVDLDAIPLERIAHERERYLRYMADALGESIGDRMHIDKNPSTIMLIPGMLRLWPECKLLIAIRDPRDVIVSCFMRYLPLNTVSAQFLTIEGTANRYVRDIEAWLRLREILPDQWLEVRYEDTVSDLEREARRALEFLGVAWDESVLEYRTRLTAKQVNSPTYEDVAKAIYQTSVARWRNYEKYLEPVFEQLAPFVSQFGYEDPR